MELTTSLPLLILQISLILADTTLDITIPKNFTRSRFSQRNHNASALVASLTDAPSTTETPLPLSSSAAPDFREPPVETFLDIDPSTEDPMSDCGVSKAGYHPWIAVLEHTDATGESLQKTLSKGVLIGDRHVLTTVSSVYNSQKNFRVSRVRLGDSPTWASNHTPNPHDIQRIDVDTVYNHRYRDIAIVRLTEPIQRRSDTVQPICLPPSNSYNYRELQLHRCVRPAPMSYGARRPRVTSIDVQVVQPQDCSVWFRRLNAEYTADEFCAWDELGDTCTGDLGGPLVARWNGRDYVVGLSSFLKGRDGDEVYDSKQHPGVYSSVGAHLQWIATVLSL